MNPPIFFPYRTRNILHIFFIFDRPRFTSLSMILTLALYTVYHIFYTDIFFTLPNRWTFVVAGICRSGDLSQRGFVLAGICRSGHLSQRGFVVAGICSDEEGQLPLEPTDKTIRRKRQGTASRNHNRIVFQEMSSWTPLTMYLGMKTAFQTKYIKRKYVRIFIVMILILYNIIRKYILLTLQQH